MRISDGTTYNFGSKLKNKDVEVRSTKGQARTREEEEDAGGRGRYIVKTMTPAMCEEEFKYVH